jgi:hypothetical protein
MTACPAASAGLLALLCASAALPAFALDIEGHVALGFAVGHPDLDTEDTKPLARLDYRLSHRAAIGTADLAFVLGGELSADEPGALRTHALREAYVEISGEAGSFGLGRHVQVQGVADGFNPTDVVAPRNFRLSRYETEANRFGLDGVWGTAFLGESLTVSGYAYDGRRSNLLPNGVYSGGLSLPDRPVESADPAYGGRVSYLAGIGDLGFSFYRGGAAHPVLVLSGGDVLAAVPELTMVGIDADTVFGAWRIYGEVALHRYSAGEFAVADGFLPDDEILSVLGVERELPDGSSLGFQIFHRNLQGERNPDGGIGAELAGAVRSVYGQHEDAQTGASLSFTWSSEDTRWNAEALVSSWFEGDHYLGLRMKYRLSDQSALYLHGTWMDGPDGTLFGDLRDSSNLALEYRYFF